MKIAVIGAGFTGLAAAYTLVKKNHDVVVFEKDSLPGGLAVGFKEKEWDWTLEKHYHHWFTNDSSILTLVREINYPVITKTPKTSWYINNKIYKFDSIRAALTFPLISPIERIRQLMVLALLRYDPFWKQLEKFKTNEVLPKLMGKKIYSMFWEPILVSKFGEHAKDISLAWFWARIKKRTQSLVYPKGGFLAFAEYLTRIIEDKGGKVLFNNELLSLSSSGSVSVKIKNIEGKITNYTFDKVIVTLPSFLFLNIAQQLPNDYRNKLGKLKGLGAANVLLRLKQPFFKDNTYWLSVADGASPIMAIVEHTNFVDKKYYNREHLVYLGNYLSARHPNFSKDKKSLLKQYEPFLLKINPEYRKSLIGYELFRAPFAQPIIPTNYSKIIPPFKTPLANVFLANIEQVYPWDRGTNYAVELGIKAANKVIKI